MSANLPMTQAQWRACIVYQEEDLIVISKPATVAVQSKQFGDLVDLAEAYERRTPKIIHRLDQPCTGLVILPFDQHKAALLAKAFRDRTIKKTYLAVVDHKPQPLEGKLVHYLTKSRNQNRMNAVLAPEGRRAELEYALHASSDRYHLLKVQLKTGRQHQIRAQLGVIGSPIKGDIKYGFRRGNRDRSIHLHCWKMEGHILDQVVLAPLPDDPLWHFFASVL